MSRSWTLSGFGDEVDPDPWVQIAVFKALGLRHIEVRSAWSTNVIDLDDKRLAELQTMFRSHSISVSAIASPIGKVEVTVDVSHEVERLKRIIHVARSLGTNNIRVFSFFRPADVSPHSIRDDVLARMRALADLAMREGVTLLHENEKGIYGDIPERVLDVIESVGSPFLQVAWDSANFVQVGVRPYDEGYGLLKAHIKYFQVKDAIAKTGEVVPAGHGDGQLRETLTALRDDNFQGFVSLEPHLESAYALGGFSGPEAFGDAVDALRKLLDEIGVESQ